MGIGEVGRRGFLQLLRPGVREHQEFLETLRELGEAGQRLRSVLRTFKPWKNAFDPSLF